MRNPFYHSNSKPLHIWLRISPKEFAECALVYYASSQLENGLRCGFFGGRESKAIEFYEQYTDHKSSALIAIYEWMVLYDARYVLRRELDDVRTCISYMIPWSG